MITDPIADMLTRIRNANQRFHKSVDIPFSKTKLQILTLLKREGYINSIKISKDKLKIVIFLKYNGKNKRITGLKRISKPGLRVYSKSTELPKVLNGLGLAIISTSKGIITGKQAFLQKLGGEVIAYVW